MKRHEKRRNNGRFEEETKINWINVSRNSHALLDKKTGRCEELLPEKSRKCHIKHKEKLGCENHSQGFPWQLKLNFRMDSEFPSD